MENKNKTNKKKLARPLYVIAKEIIANWKTLNKSAAWPYCEAMMHLTVMSDKYGFDNADSIVRYFLSNATYWRGETARRIKAELNSML